MWDVSIKIMKPEQAMTCVAYLHTREEMQGIIHTFLLHFPERNLVINIKGIIPPGQSFDAR